MINSYILVEEKIKGKSKFSFYRLIEYSGEITAYEYVPNGFLINKEERKLSVLVNFIPQIGENSLKSEYFESKFVDYSEGIEKILEQSRNQRAEKLFCDEQAA